MYFATVHFLGRIYLQHWLFLTRHQAGGTKISLEQTEKVLNMNHVLSSK